MRVKRFTGPCLKVAKIRLPWKAYMHSLSPKTSLFSSKITQEKSYSGFPNQQIFKVLKLEEVWKSEQNWHYKDVEKRTSYIISEFVDKNEKT